jgi:hypothetical protein
MKFIIMTIAFFSFGLFAKPYDTSLYEISFIAKVRHNKYDTQKAIRYQIVHSLGPGLNRRGIGLRSSLNYNYNIEVISEVKTDSFTETKYKYSGELLVEESINLNNYKLILPLNSETIFDSAKRFKGYCSKSPYKGIEKLFYFSWSPHTRRCGLKKDKDYLEVSVESFHKKNDVSSHLSKEFIINGKYKLFYYYGSDHFSMRNFGQASNMYSTTVSALKRLGFKKIKRSKMKKHIFKREQVQSRFMHMKGTLKGVPAEAYILLGNPTDSTPQAKKEFFYFTKYALENGSSYTYAGHAGLGSVFNLDYMEKEYGVKINYLTDQKQFLYIDGCITFFYSSNFFFKKKALPNTLVLVTNGASILTVHYKQAVFSFLDVINKSLNTNTEIKTRANFYMRRQRASKNDFALVNVLSN